MRKGRLCAALAGALLALFAAPGTAQAGRWVAGDLHVHTTYSHDSYGGPGDDNTGPEDVFTLGHTVTDDFAIARTRGLDFMAISDHMDVRSQSDPGFGTSGVLGLPAYENSLNGHAQMLGATHVFDNGDESTAAVLALENALHAEGGLLQANHPNDPRWGYGYDVPVDTVEVWNLPWYYQPPLPASSNNTWALHYWEGWLDRGAHVAATGGSDNHWLSTTAAQGPGQPTTWVYVRKLGVRGVLDGLRAGHTFVSAEPPAYGGARVHLEAGARYRAIAGDTVRRGSRFRVRVRNAPGSYLRIVTDGGREAFAPVLVTSPRFTYKFRIRRGTWVRAEVYGEDAKAGREQGCTAIYDHAGAFAETYCTNRVAMQALSSAIYLR
ncbi:MAG: hypothetical protein QOH76_83 [Thermoleophilaceae bacterium]|nr:hypothetical protein [Thermoleophilaceae bacterium]